MQNLVRCEARKVYAKYLAEAGNDAALLMNVDGDCDNVGWNGVELRYSDPQKAEPDEFWRLCCFHRDCFMRNPEVRRRANAS